MAIIDRIKQLALPLDQLVVIGSGVLEALDLRTARDIDLVVSVQLFSNLKTSADWKLSIRHDEEVIENGDVEIWQSWGTDGIPNFEDLYKNGFTLDGVRFTDPIFVLQQKELRAEYKDRDDVMILKEYLHERA